MGLPVVLDGNTQAVLTEVYRERQRQEQLREQGKFSWTCAAPGISNAEKLAVLAEEFGEVSKEVVEQIINFDNTTARDNELKANIRKELIQVAAVAVAWVESI